MDGRSVVCQVGAGEIAPRPEAIARAGGELAAAFRLLVGGAIRWHRVGAPPLVDGRSQVASRATGRN